MGQSVEKFCLCKFYDLLSPEESSSVFPQTQSEELMQQFTGAAVVGRDEADEENLRELTMAGGWSTEQDDEEGEEQVLAQEDLRSEDSASGAASIRRDKN